MIDWNERPRYETDNGVSLARLPWLLFGPPLAALVVAWLLKTAYVTGWYFLGVVPAFAGLILGGLLHLVVGLSHCRNRWLAAGVGMVAGLAAFLGYYHLCMLENMPPGSALRFDELPGYIQDRLHTDIAVDPARPFRRRAVPSVFMNTFSFLLDLALLVGIATAVSWIRGGRAYCPGLRQWMVQENAVLPPYSFDRVEEAFETGDLAGFAACTVPGGNAQSSCLLTLEYVAPHSTLDMPIYLTVQDHPEQRSWFQGKNARHTFVRQTLLEPSEALALRRLFPQFDNLTKETPAAAAAAPVVFEAVDAPHAVATSPLPAAIVATRLDVAEITPVPEPHGRVVRTKWYPWLVNLVGGLPLVFLLGGLALLVSGGYLVSQGEFLVAMLAFLVGGLSLALATYVGLYAPFGLEGMWIENRLRSKFTGRPGLLVDPADADSVGVSLIPRAHFTKVMMTMATDILLLAEDAERRELLLEGDSDRYRIPIGAILDCEPERFFHPMDKACQTELWMSRLQVQGPDGPFEMLLALFHTDLWPMTNDRRREAAEDFCRRINRFRGVRTARAKARRR